MFEFDHLPLINLNSKPMYSDIESIPAPLACKELPTPVHGPEALAICLPFSATSIQSELAEDIPKFPHVQQ